MNNAFSRCQSYHSQIRKQVNDQYFQQRRKQLIASRSNNGNQSIDCLTPQELALIQQANSQKSNLNLQQRIMHKLIEPQALQKTENLVFLSNFISRTDFNRELLPQQIIAQTVKQVMFKCFQKSRDHIEIVCWTVLCLYRVYKNPNHLVEGNLISFYDIFVNRLGYKNGFLLTLWAQITEHPQLIPKQKFITGLRQVPLKAIFTENNNQGLKVQFQELATLIIIIIANSLLLSNIQLSSFQEVRFIMWIADSMQIRALPSKSKTHLINILTHMFQRKISHQAFIYFFNTYLLDELILRTRIDNQLGKISSCQCLCMIIKNMQESRLSEFIKSKQLIECLVPLLGFKENLLIVLLLKAIGKMLMCDQDQSIKKKLIKQNFIAYASNLIEHPNERIYELTLAIMESYFSQYVPV